MRTLFRVVMALLLLTAVAVPEPCQPDAEMLGAVKQYLAWAKEWWGRNLLLDERTELQAVSSGNISYLYLAERSLVLFYNPSGESSLVGSFRCTEPSQEWLYCVERSLRFAKPENNPYLWWLQGRAGSRSEVPWEHTPVCGLTVRSDSVGLWRPSPSSPAKEELEAAITAEVIQRLSEWRSSTIRAAVSNDFNIDDPAVYVLVDYVDAPGDEGRALFYILMNGRRKPRPYVYISRMDFRPDEALVEKIFRSPIELDVKGAAPVAQ